MTKTPATEQWQERRDYRLIPNEENGWNVIITSGEFEDTEIRYNWVKFDEANLMFMFDYSLIESPIRRLTAEDEGLKKAAAGIMHAILVKMADEAEEDK